MWHQHGFSHASLIRIYTLQEGIVPGRVLVPKIFRKEPSRRNRYNLYRMSPISKIALQMRIHTQDHIADIARDHMMFDSRTPYVFIHEQA